MRRSPLITPAFISLVLAIAALIALLVSIGTPIHLTHQPSATSAGFFLRSTHGRLYAITRSDHGMGRWPGFSGWEYKTGRNIGLIFLAPAVREPAWKGFGFDWETVNLKSSPHTVRYLAIPWWALMAAFCILPIVTILFRIYQNAHSERYCPVCFFNTGGLPRPCPRCGTKAENGAVPCNASPQIPPGIQTTAATRDSASFCNARIIIRGDVASVRQSRAGRRFSLIIIAVGAITLTIAYNLFRSGDWFEIIAATIPTIAGLVFTGAGFLLLTFPHRVLIDRIAARAFVSGDAPMKDFPLTPEDMLQVLAKQAGTKATFQCYELNLVLAGGGRINLLSHGNSALLREDAHKLAEFLHISLLDHTGERVSHDGGRAGFAIRNSAVLASG